MSDAGDGTAAERRLVGLLAALRGAAPPVDAALAREVMRTARWQHAVRVPLRTAGLLAAAIAEGVGVLLSGGRRRGER